MTLGTDWSRMAANTNADESERYYSDHNPNYSSVGTEKRWGLWTVDYETLPNGRRRANRQFTGRTFTRQAGADRAAARANRAGA
jgi:hypothetical protein